jgi:hypothetical protein
MGVLENKLFIEIDALPASKTFFVAFCARNQVATSETRMAQAKGGKDYGSEQIIALLNQVSRLKKFRDSMSPLTIRFDDADVMTNLVNDFEAGKLSITVNRFEEIQLIRKVYWIEFADQTLFRGVLNGDIQKTNVPGEAAAIADERTAKAAGDLLLKMGRTCRVTDGRIRIAESKLAKNLADLGFKPEPVTTAVESSD